LLLPLAAWGQTGAPAGAILEPIVVTARRLPEDQQRTPVSVIALTAADLELRSATNMRDLQRLVPNLTFAPAQNVGDAAANIFIRGIGQEDFAAGTEAGVGLYLDGVPIGRTMGAMTDLIDVARVEVLRGPQGTLYGRNTVGGAINIISAAPDTEPEGRVSLIAGSFDRVETRGMVNLPLADRLLLRVAATRGVRDGYLRRLPAPFAPTGFTETDSRTEGADHRLAGRLQLRWLASEALVLDLAIDGSRRRGTQSPTHLDAINPLAPNSNLPNINQLIRGGVLPGPEITNALVTADLLTSRSGGGNRIAQDVLGASITATGTLGAHELRLIAGWRRLVSDVASDTDGTWFNMFSGAFDERQQQYSVEGRASGTLAGIVYTAGAILYHDDAELLPVGQAGQDVLYYCGCLYTPQTRPRTLFPARQTIGTSLGAYAQATAPLAPRLRATLGLRYSQDRKRIDARMVLLDPLTLEPTMQVVATGANRGRWGSLTWRVGLDYQASADVMAYASIAKGFKSGGFNVRPALNLVNLGLAAYRPEIAISYEAGVRSQWLDDRLRLNATVFHADYRDIQLRQQTVFGGIATTLVENAARARVRGIEVEAVGRPLPGLTLNLSWGHLAARYRDVGKVPGLTLDSAFQRAPRNSLTAAIDQSLTLGSGTLLLHGDYSYRAREQFQLTASPWDQPGYGLIGARIGWRDAGDRWSLALFATNLADIRYRSAGRANLLNQSGFANSIIGRPREIGIEFGIVY
jgi:iron complex outermembrane receptor protein